MLREYLRLELLNDGIIKKHTSSGKSDSIVEKSFNAVLKSCQMYFKLIDKVTVQIIPRNVGNDGYNDIYNNYNGSKRKLNNLSNSGQFDRDNTNKVDETIETEDEVDRILEEQPVVQKRRKKGRPRNVSREREAQQASHGEPQPLVEAEEDEPPTKSEEAEDERLARRERRASLNADTTPRENTASKPSKIIIKNPYRKQEEQVKQEEQEIESLANLNDSNATQHLLQPPPQQAPPATPPEIAKAREEVKRAEEASEMELKLLYEQIEQLKQARQAQEAQESQWLNQRNKQYEPTKLRVRKSQLLVKLDLKRIQSKSSTPSHAPAKAVGNKETKKAQLAPLATTSASSSPLSAPPSLPTISSSSSEASDNEEIRSDEFHINSAVASPPHRRLESPDITRLSLSPNIPPKQFELNRPTMLPPINLPPIQGSDRPHLPPISGNQQSRDLPMPFPAQNNKMGVQAILSESSYQPPQTYPYSQSPKYFQNEPNYSPNYPQRPLPASHAQSPVPWSSGAISNQPLPPQSQSPVYSNQSNPPPPFPHTQPSLYQQPQYDAAQAQQFTAPRSRPEYGSMDEVVARQQAHISRSQTTDSLSRSTTSKRKRDQAPALQGEEPLYQDPTHNYNQQFSQETAQEEDEDVEYQPQRQRQVLEERERLPSKVKNAHDREREALFVYKDLDVYDAQGSLKVASDGVHDVLSKTPRFSIGRHVYQPAELVDFYPHQIGGVFEMYVPGAWLGDNWAVRELLPQKNGDTVELAPKVRHVRGKTNGLALTDLDALDERRIWGTDVYTDDSDPIAIAVHLGWLFDASDKSYDRRSLVGAGRPAEGEKVDDIIEDADLVLVFRVAPRLVAYHSSMRHRLWSRGWGNQHDGFSLVLEECKLIPKDKTNVIRPSKQLRKARIALIAQARKAIIDSPSVQVKENDVDAEAADENDVWKLLSEDQKRPEKNKFNKNTKMIRRGDRRFKRVQKEESEIELETQLAIQQEKEQKRLKEDEKKKDEDEKKKEEDEKKTDEDEKNRLEDEQRKAEESGKGALEEQGKGIEDTQHNAVEMVESQTSDAPQLSQEQGQHTPQQPQERQVRKEQANAVQQEQSLQENVSEQQQEDKKPEKSEVELQQSDKQEQEQKQDQIEGGRLAAQQQNNDSVSAPETQSTQELSSNQAVDSTHSTQLQQLTKAAKPEADHPSAPEPAQASQDVSMEVDTQNTQQPETDVKTFSVTEAQPRQTFTINQNPYDPVQMNKSPAQSTPQPGAEAPQIMFVNHHTAGDHQNCSFELSQVQSDASATHTPRAQDSAFVKQEDDSQSTQASFSIASESNGNDNTTSQLPSQNESL
ncbi:hypothetical protein E3P92_04132 [Wallemia ichthyophaga]|nr:hypothetical protein E3P92_04132 [Wallemia ichthyophaga]